MGNLSILQAGLCLLAIYVLKKALAYRRMARSLGHHPGQIFCFGIGTIPGLLLPQMKYVNQTHTYAFQDKYDVFAEYGCDVLTKITLWPTQTFVSLADAALIKEVFSSRSRFPKPWKNYWPVAFWGQNIVVSEGELWKKYRKIAAPAFSDRNNKLVWDETIKIMQGLTEEIWAGREIVTVDHCLDITLPIALFVIGAAGFGKRLSWSDEDLIPPGHTMTFKGSLHVVMKQFIMKVMTPKWLLEKGLTTKMRNTRDGFNELHRYITEMIRERQTSEKVERHDLLSSLLEANDDSQDAGTLTEDELISNVYVFLVAGHETTAHTMAFALGLLAIYPDEQEKLFKHIQTVLSDGRTPVYEDLPLLTYALAVINETLRMFPPVDVVPKLAAEDAILSTVDKNGKLITVPVPRGCNVSLVVPALHYNPRYWEEPSKFRPQRFLEDWPRDAFLPFSAGPRACIGRKFAETEAVATLTTLVSQFRISVKEEPQFSGESFEQRKSRVLATTQGLTLTPRRVPLQFTRRR